MIKRTMLRMQGKGRGTLALEAGETLQYQLNSTIAATDAKLVLFFDTQNYKVVEGSVGEVEAVPETVQAAAVVQNNTFLLTGAYEQFDWPIAKQLYLHQDGQPQANNENALAQEPSVQQILDALSPKKASEEENEQPVNKEEQLPFVNDIKKEKVVHPFKQIEEVTPVMQIDKEEIFANAPALETSDILKQISPKAETAPTKNVEEPVAPKYVHSVLPRDVADTDACIILEEEQISPFSYVLPNAEWKKVTYPYNLGVGYYLAGELYEENIITATAVAVPGTYAINPPPWLGGFQTYLEDNQTKQGYWLFFRDAKTGQPTSLEQITKKSQ